MPAIMPADKYGVWLDPGEHDTGKLQGLLRPYPSGEIELYPVTPKVNSCKNNDLENIRPIPEPA